MVKTSFNAIQHGFKFSNNFVNKVIVVPSLGINFTTAGRCGGMAFAALDYWHHRLEIPPEAGLPVDGTPLSTYISIRLDHSIINNAFRYFQAMVASDHLDWLLGKGVARATRENEFLITLKQSIDQGQPCALGLTQARDVSGFGSDHQVVAYGYEVGNLDSTILIYDNNEANKEHRLTFRTVYDPTNYEIHNSCGNRVFRGFFVESYAPLFPFSLMTNSSGPTVSSRGPGRLDVFVRRTDNAFYLKSWNGSQWSNYEQLGSEEISSDPAVVSWGPNRIDVFVRGTDNALYQKSWNGSQWSNYEQLGSNQISSDPAAVSWGPNRIDVFVRGTDNALYQKSWDGSQWSDYTQLGSNQIL